MADNRFDKGELNAEVPIKYVDLVNCSSIGLFQVQKILIRNYNSMSFSNCLLHRDIVSFK